MRSAKPEIGCIAHYFCLLGVVQIAAWAGKKNEKSRQMS